jgi:phage-related minor tail protein
MHAQQVQAQLNAVLKSTGGVAGITAIQVNAYAEVMSKVTMFDDEAIVSAQSMLLTFTNIGSSVFPSATSAVLDMSQALGQDLQSSAIMLGKALQNPIMGVTALRRVGVNFTEEQQELIKFLVESGQLEEAQALILKELKTEFGGSAEAAGKTFVERTLVCGARCRGMERYEPGGCGEAGMERLLEGVRTQPGGMCW